MDLPETQPGRSCFDDYMNEELEGAAYLRMAVAGGSGLS